MPPTGSGQAEAKVNAQAAYLGLFSGNFAGISGNTAAIGYQGVLANVSGHVTIYVWDSCQSTWTEQQTVTSSNVGPYDMFGSSLSLEGDSLLVGANYFNSQNSGADGAVYQFKRSGSTWTQAQAIYPPTGAGRFGWALAQSGSTMAVGSILGKDPTSTITYSGIVSIYTKAQNGNWTYRVPVTPAEIAQWDYYGMSVALDNGTLVAGGPGAMPTTASGRVGKAWVFAGSGDTWTQQGYLQPSDGAAGDAFGLSVAYSGGRVFVGAPKHDGAGSDAGAAYVFTYANNAWSQTAKLTASDAVADALFGYTVAAVSSTRVLVGAPGAKKIYSFSYDGSGWTQDPTYTACGNGVVGYSLSVSGNLAVSARGGAWFFDLADPDTSCVGP